MRLSVVDTELCVGCQCCMFACARRSGLGGMGSSAIAVRSIGGMEKGFKVIVCRACENPPCARACPTGALTPKPGGGVHLAANKCIGCGRCVEACVLGAVQWDTDTSKPAICVQCGYCVSFCPHGVLAMEDN